MSFDDLRGLASNQFGLFTTAQATKLEVGRSKLHSLLQKSELRLVRRGVYAFDIFAPDANEELRAAWLSLDPSKTVAERLRDDQCAVVATTSAAYLHGLGNFMTYSHEFFVPIRKQSRAEDIHIRMRVLPSSDVEVVEGLKVTSVTRTALDLLADGEEIEHISDFLADAARKKKSVDWKRIKGESAKYQKVYGLTGDKIFNQLSDIQGVSLEDRIAYRAAINSATDYEWLISSQEQTSNTLRELNFLPSVQTTISSSLAPLREEVQKILRDAIEPTLAEIRKIQAISTTREEAKDEQSD